METVTIPKAEYESLKKAQERLEAQQHMREVVNDLKAGRVEKVFSD